MTTPRTVIAADSAADSATGAADDGAPTLALPTYRDRIRAVALSDIAPPRVPLREAIDREAVRAIARTMREDGLYQLPGVRRVGRRRYELLWGQTRLHAALEAGWTRIEVVVFEGVGDRQAMLLGIRENTQRRDLTPADKVRIIAALRASGLNGEEIAAATDIAASDVSRLPRIAARPLLWDAITAKTLLPREAQELLTLPDDRLSPLLALIAARRADGTAMAIVAELRPLAAAARPADAATAPPPRRPAPPLVRVERAIAGLARIADDSAWDDDTLALAEGLLALLAGVIAQQRARR